MPKIAISYRRINLSAIAGRIADQLAARYGRKSIFGVDDAVSGEETNSSGSLTILTAMRRASSPRGIILYNRLRN